MTSISISGKVAYLISFSLIGIYNKKYRKSEGDFERAMAAISGLFSPSLKGLRGGKVINRKKAQVLREEIPNKTIYSFQEPSKWRNFNLNVVHVLGIDQFSSSLNYIIEIADTE